MTKTWIVLSTLLVSSLAIAAQMSVGLQPTDHAAPYPTHTPYPTSTPYPPNKPYSDMRMDCRFYSRPAHPKHYCYASANYKVDNYKKEIQHVIYGVGCDHQTLYSGKGTTEPQETVADHIRPAYAATPMVQLEQQHDLREVGSYTAKLELSAGELYKGHCYVSDEEDGYPAEIDAISSQQ